MVITKNMIIIAIFIGYNRHIDAAVEDYYFTNSSYYYSELFL